MDKLSLNAADIGERGRVIYDAQVTEVSHIVDANYLRTSQLLEHDIARRLKEVCATAANVRNAVQ